MVSVALKTLNSLMVDLQHFVLTIQDLESSSPGVRLNQVLFDSTFITVVGVDVVVVVYYPILPTSIFEDRIKGVPLRGMMFNI